MTGIEEKKTFIKWVLETFTLQKRESYWVLNYLLNHEVLLTKIIFVRDALATPRGLRISESSISDDDSGMVLVKDGLLFDDPEQIFHDIRLNWRQVLYVEIEFPNASRYLPYQAVLEINPYVPETNEIDSEWDYSLDAFLNNYDQTVQLANLLTAINQAIDEEDETSFKQLTKKYNHLKKLMSEK